MISDIDGAALAVYVSFCKLKGIVLMDLLKSTAKHSAHELSSDSLLFEIQCVPDQLGCIEFFPLFCLNQSNFLSEKL